VTPPPTPALVLDGGALDRNIAAMQRNADEAGVALRPHVKGHKSAWIAARQVRAGAVGLAAATLEEAAGLLRAGAATDVLLTSDAPARAIDDIVALQWLGDLAVVADHPAFVAALAAAHRGGRPVRVFADLDVGQRRGGARTAKAAVAVADAVAGVPGALVFAGVQAYEGHAQLAPDEERRARHAGAMAALRELLDALGAAGHAVPVVTSAGTGTAPLAQDPVTEIQPGSYALMDATYRDAGAPFEQALHILTAVRSLVAGNEAVVDAGLKAVSIDMGPARPAGLAATWKPAGDEHGLLEGDLGDLGPGDLVRLVPSHTDTAIRLHRELWLDGEIALPLF
jgi:D-serine deaminase-like pyridoxal phosphate-dependent protein